MKSFKFFKPALATTLGNRFLASCPTLSNGCFSYRLSQPSKRSDI